MSNLCSYCDEHAVCNVLIRIGVEHPAHDQRDTSRLEVVRMCADHQSSLVLGILLAGRIR